jgi:hypothetical protein
MNCCGTAVAGCASIVFRWRFPVAALGVACGSAALFNALAGHFGDRDGSALACIPVALTVYAVVTASARRAVPVIPGTRRVARVEENTAADRIQLSDAQLNRLSNLTPAAGERHDQANMASIDR